MLVLSVGNVESHNFGFGPLIRIVTLAATPLKMNIPSLALPSQGFDISEHLRTP